MRLPYIELQASSNFSFLQGASHPEEIVSAAHELGYQGIAVTDQNSFAGIVRAYFSAKELGIKYIVGTRLVATLNAAAPFEVLAYPKTRAAYGNLCAVLSRGNLRSEKGQCSISLEEILEHQKDVSFIAVPPRTTKGASSDFKERILTFSRQLQEFYLGIENKASIYLALTYFYGNLEQERLNFIEETAKQLKLPLIASNDSFYHAPSRRALQDVLTCIRERIEIKKAGFLLSHNAERYLKPLNELKRLYRFFPEAFHNTQAFADQCLFSLEELRYEYPSEVCPPAVTPQEYLRQLTFSGAEERFSGSIPENIKKLLNEELQLIKELKYEHYFLTCYDIVRYARSIGVLCQGRGAAANSAVCFCLGVTAVDPSKIELLFARFVSKERNEPPDIDIDFEHERREEVMQYIYDKYGRNRAGLVANVITYRHRSAVREVGKALGLSLETVGLITSLIHFWDRCKIDPKDLLDAGLNPNDPMIVNCFALASELLGFPRHLSQHSGGFVISEKLLSHTVPILNSAMESRTIIEWNKDDIDLLGMLKIDILALGMLTCIRKALEFINNKPEHCNKPLQLYTIPADDSEVYDMICKADTIGVFQIESRAQMSMLPRLKPRCFYDLVIEVAIVRPGPIHGDMVHPFLKRRAGLEEVKFPDENIKSILGKTLGVPLFQEQAMRLAMVVGGFTAAEADKLRRAIAAWRRNKNVLDAFEAKIEKGMLKNGYSKEFIHACVEQMKGFSEYGFPESHAASFAHLVYASSWIKKYYPAEFTAALINSQPMGFYSPSELIRDAKAHGINVLSIDILRSDWDCFVDHEGSLRLGLCLVKGLQEEQAKIIGLVRDIFPEVKTIKELYCFAQHLKVQIRRDSLALIARADGFQSMGLDQREALWLIKGLPIQSGPLDSKLVEKGAPALPKMNLQQSMFLDYRSTGLSIKAHPLMFMRERLNSRNALKSSQLKEAKVKSIIKVAGLITCRQRPGTAQGIVFLTLEDENGYSNLIIKPNIYEKYRRIVVSSTAIVAQGRIERTGDVIHIIATQLESLDDWLTELKEADTPSRSYSY